MEKTAKTKSVSAVPEGFHTVTPYLVVDNAQGLLEFMKTAFDGKVSFVSKMDDGRIAHATVSIGDSIVMVADTMEGMEAQTAMLYLYMEDADAVFKKALKAKATSVREPKTEFYGDRSGAVKDDWGNLWWIATQVEELDPAELDRRTKKEMEARKQQGREVHA